MQTVYFKKDGKFGVGQVDLEGEKRPSWKHSSKIENWLRSRKITQAWFRYGNSVVWTKVKYVKIDTKERKFKWFQLPSTNMLPEEIHMFELLAE